MPFFRDSALDEINVFYSCLFVIVSMQTHDDVGEEQAALNWTCVTWELLNRFHHVFDSNETTTA